jgi:membrane-associated PAP2 superfamily phosphatase
MSSGATVRRGADRDCESLIHDALPIFGAFVALVAWEASGLDLPIVRLYGSAGGFPWRAQWLAAQLLPGEVRIVAGCLALLLLAAVWHPIAFARAVSRRDRGWWFATTVGCIALLELARGASATSCPWSLQEFGGGVAHYVPHWALGRHDGGPGRCFPSAQVATAFAFLAGWFALRRPAPRAAAVWLLTTIVVGSLLAWAQVAGGAHYPSHCLWTAWLCWSITALSYHASKRWRASASPQVAGTGPPARQPLARRDDHGVAFVDTVPSTRFAPGEMPPSRPSSASGSPTFSSSAFPCTRTERRTR